MSEPASASALPSTVPPDVPFLTRFHWGKGTLSAPSPPQPISEAWPWEWPSQTSCPPPPSAPCVGFALCVNWASRTPHPPSHSPRGKPKLLSSPALLLCWAPSHRADVGNTCVSTSLGDTGVWGAGISPWWSSPSCRSNILFPESSPNHQTGVVPERPGSTNPAPASSSGVGNTSNSDL